MFWSNSIIFFSFYIIVVKNIMSQITLIIFTSVYVNAYFFKRTCLLEISSSIDVFQIMQILRRKMKQIIRFNKINQNLLWIELMKSLRSHIFIINFLNLWINKTLHFSIETLLYFHFKGVVEKWSEKNYITGNIYSKK